MTADRAHGSAGDRSLRVGDTPSRPWAGHIDALLDLTALEGDSGVDTSRVGGMEGEASVVGGGDGLDNGEAQAESVVVACPIAGDSLEGLEETVDLVRGQGRAGVGDSERGESVTVLYGHPYTPAGIVVTQGVVDEVRNEPFDELGVAGDGGRAE